MLTNEQKAELVRKEITELEARRYLRELDIKKVRRLISARLSPADSEIQLQRDIEALNEAIAALEEELGELEQSG